MNNTLCSNHFADALRDSTRELHAEAERTGVIGELLRGESSPYAYALLLRNLLPAYRALERALENHKAAAGIRLVALPAVYRAEFIEADLLALYGLAWRDRLPLLPSGERYAERITGCACGEQNRLIAHAYTRYLGDLNGGRVMSKRIANTLNLTADALTFYTFPDVREIAAFKTMYRDAFDQAANEIADASAVVDETKKAFQLNIDLSLEIAKKVRSSERKQDSASVDA